MKPTIGRIVHYYEGEQGPLAAIITTTWSDVIVNLHVFFSSKRGTVVEVTSVRFAEVPKLGERTWCWPPKV